MNDAALDELIKKLMISNPDYRNIAENLQNQILQTAIDSQDVFYGYRASKEFFYDYFNNARITEFTIYFSHWKELGSALISQAILRPGIKIPGIKVDYELLDRDAETYTNELYQNLYLAYMRRYVEKLFLEIYTQLLPEKKEAADKYLKKLKLSVPLHEIWYAYQEWNSPRNELFHHYAKILSLGESEETVDRLIVRLKELGLSVPKEVDAKNWKSYRGFFNNERFLSAENLIKIASNSARGEFFPLEIHFPDKMFPLLYVVSQHRYIIPPKAHVAAQRDTPL